jgi:hypothetical protein
MPQDVKNQYSAEYDQISAECKDFKEKYARHLILDKKYGLILDPA